MSSLQDKDAFHACFTPRFDLEVQPSEYENMLTDLRLWCNEMKKDQSRPNQRDNEQFNKLKDLPFFRKRLWRDMSDKTVPESADEWIADVRRSTAELDDSFESLTLPEVTADEPPQVYFFFSRDAFPLSLPLFVHS